MAVILDILGTLEAPSLLLRGAATVLVLIVLSHLSREIADGFPYKNIPLVGKSRWEISNTKAKERFVNGAQELIQQGFSQVGLFGAAVRKRTMLTESLYNRAEQHSRLCSLIVW